MVTFDKKNVSFFLYFFRQHDKHSCIQLNADIILVVNNMPENYNMFDKLGGNIQKMKLEKAIEMLRNENPQELRKKLGQLDTNEILEKMDEYDSKKLSQMGINLDELKRKITDKDFEKLIQILGPDGALIAKKLKSLLK